MAGSYSHDFTVKARDAAGNTSVASPVLTVLVEPLPAAPANLTAVQKTDGSSKVDLSWTAAQYAGTYEVQIDGATVASGLTGTTYTTAAQTGGLRAYRVRGISTGGPGAWAALSITVDTTAPTNPPSTNLTALGHVVTLTWSASASSDVANYKVFRDGALVTTTTGFAFSESLPDGSYAYKLNAIDTHGNENAGLTVGTIVVDTTPPTNPTTFNVTSSGATVTVNWNASPSADIASYKVFRDGEQVGSTSSRTFSESLIDGSYTYQLSSIDGHGNESTSATVGTVTVDTVPVVTQENLGRQVTLNWDPIPGAILYAIRLNGNPVGTTTNTSYVGVVPSDGTWYYQVAAKSPPSIWSAYSTREDIEIDTTALVPPVITSAGVKKELLVRVEWEDLDNPSVTKVDVSRDDVVLDTIDPDVTYYEDTVPKPGTYVYKVRVSDNIGDYSPWSDPATVVVDEWRSNAFPTVLRPPLRTVEPLLPAETVGRDPLIPPRIFNTTTEEEVVSP